MAPARARPSSARRRRCCCTWASGRPTGIPAEVRTPTRTSCAAQKDIERGTEAVKKAKKWMVEASADYNIGFLDVREVVRRRELYVTLRTALMKARFDHNVAMAALSKATATLDSDGELFYLGARTAGRGRGAP